MHDAASLASTIERETVSEVKPLPHWEQREELGSVMAFLQTFVDFYTYRTRKTYLQMPVEGSIAGPLLFAIAAQVLFSIFFIGTCWFVAQNSLRTRTDAQIFDLYIDSATIVFTMPIAMTVIVLIAGWLAHGLLVLCVKEVGDFRGTLRIMLYAYGAAQLLNLVPFLALVVGWIWLYGTGVIGLRAVHGVSRKWAFLAMFPVALAYAILALIEHNLIPPYLR